MLGGGELGQFQLALAHPSLGRALWFPQLGIHQGTPSIEIGDLGYVRPGNGGFERVFNVLLPGDHPSHAWFGVPEDYKPLVLHEKDHIECEDLDPHNYCSLGISGVPSSGGASPPD
jgi:hypothetical protein